MTDKIRNSLEVRRQSGLWVSSALSRRQILLGAGGVVAAGALVACSSDTSPSNSPTGNPKRGGNFRIGVTGGGSKDIIDGQNASETPDVARLVTAFETLLTFDENLQLTTDGLAESVEADSPTQYTIKLRQGINFSDGKPLTADDVIYSLQRVGGDVNLRGNSASETMDLANIKKLDDYTVQLPLKTPDSTIPQKLGAYYFSIVPTGYKAFSGDPSTQIGTGAYILKSFTPGRASVHERNPNYWREGEPYFDSVTITNFSDATAQVNALLGGQIDAMTDVPAAQVEAVKSQGNKVVQTQTGLWLGLVMAVDKPPFDDARVREAFRLIADRQMMLDQVGSGFGDLGNDLYGRYDEAYFADLPQRERDIDKAKSLLEEAGQEALTVDLYGYSGTAGLASLATVFAKQAKDAGVTVNVKNLSTDAYYEGYLDYAFSATYWFGRPYLQQVQQGSLPSSPYNETHWPPTSGEGSNFEDLYNQALAATDHAERTEIEHQMQQLEYDQGGYIIPYFPANIDACAANVQGLSDGKGTYSLGNFGNGFRSIWFA